MRLAKTGRFIALHAILATLVCTGFASTAHAQSPAPNSAPNSAPGFDDFLRATIGLDAGQMKEAREGRASVKLMKTDINRDVAVFGVIGIHVTRDAYIAHAHDMQALIAARGLQYGIISDPVRPDEMQGVFFEGSEWHDLKSCRMNDCDFKLPAADMRQFSQGVNWNGPNPKQQVDSVMRREMQDLVTEYRSRGNQAMLRYDDTNEVLAGDAFSALLGQSQFLREYAPAFHDYLLNYPSGRPDSTQSVTYWSMDKIPHLRSTFAINQMIVYTPATGMTLIALKQLYADHYFESAFELSAVFDAPDLAGGPGIYLVGVRRYRFDNLPGGLLNIRGRVRSQLQKVMRADLERERDTLERRPAS